MSTSRGLALADRVPREAQLDLQISVHRLQQTALAATVVTVDTLVRTMRSSFGPPLPLARVNSKLGGREYAMIAGAYEYEFL